MKDNTFLQSMPLGANQLSDQELQANFLRSSTLANPQKFNATSPLVHKETQGRAA